MIKLDSILLFAFVIPFIMTFRIGTGDTPYWLFGLIFLGLLLYVVLDLLKLSKQTYFKLKQSLLWIIIIGVLGNAFGAAMIVRHVTHPIYMIHDMPLQQEIAIRFLLDGKNPYAEHYFGTFLEQWHFSENQVNPALYHFVLPPFYLLFALPFYFFGNTVFGFFDARMPLLVLFFSILILGSMLIKDKGKRLLFLTLFTFNPATLPQILEGRSDIFMFAFLFAGFFLLERRRYVLSSILIALAFAVKQSAWPLFPLYVAFLFFKTKSLVKTLGYLFPFGVTFGLLILPFIFWDAKAFFDSTIFYLSGSIQTSYPISGYGLGKLLHQLGVIKDLNSYYSFHIWQAAIGLPLLYVFVRALKNKPDVGRLILFYGIFLFVFWYLSRYLNNSHLGYVSMVFMISYFWPKNEGK